MNKILHELELDKPIVYVFNKADKVELTPELQKEINSFESHVTTSTVSPHGLDQLIAFLAKWNK